MKRNIVLIDEERCNGCGLCADACQEGAIQLIEGKARLIRDDYCDGLGHCLPSCPVNAISITVREADPFDEEAVIKNQAGKTHGKQLPDASGIFVCPGLRAQTLGKEKEASKPVQTLEEANAKSQLAQWPVQIQLAPRQAPYFEGASLLIAADCAAYAHANFHANFMKNKITLIGCPKLDPVNYADKLTEILKYNAIKSLSLVRMEVPCCGGLERALKQALQDSGKYIPWNVTTLSVKGEIVQDN